MTRKELTDFIRKKGSFLCVGLDTDPHKIPSQYHQESDPVFAFNKAIIDLTKDHCVAYKPNIAFYEALGSRGWCSLEKTLEYIPQTHFKIADAKRGDIGNTSKLYAKTFFSTFNFDAVTVAPYMGSDSILPFLEFDEKWVILLALTSNQGSKDFQFHTNQHGVRLFEEVLTKTAQWGSKDNMMFVVGATQAKAFSEIRTLIPDHFLLVPGVGKQGGSLDAVWEHGHNQDVGLLVNSSRGIIYAGGESEHHHDAVRQAAADLHNQMHHFLNQSDGH